jgi:hypothetical protein
MVVDAPADELEQQRQKIQAPRRLASAQGRRQGARERKMRSEAAREGMRRHRN